MLRFIVRRLLLIPLILALSNFLGFAYAHYARPIRAARTPYLRTTEERPLLPAYQTYLKELMNFNFDVEVSTPNDRNVSIPLEDVLAQAVVASIGLMSIALISSTLSAWVIGLKALKYAYFITSQNVLYKVFISIP